MKKNQVSENNDVLNVSGVREKGYGIVPKLAMQDRRLTPEAKAIYAYFCSFAGAGSTAFPGRKKILYDLQMGEKRYYSHFGLLKKYGYIHVEQQKDVETKQFNRNIYTLCENVPYSQNDCTDVTPYSRFAYTAQPCTAHDGINNNNNKINKYKNIKSSQSQNKKEDMTLTNESINYIRLIENKFFSGSGTRDISKYNTNVFSEFENIIKNNIDYTYYAEHDNTELEMIDGLIHIILDVILTENPSSVKIGNEIKSREIVKSTFLKLKSQHIDHVLEQYKKQKHKIVHKSSYLRKMLYTVGQEMDAHYVNQVRVDGVVK